MVSYFLVYVSLVLALPGIRVGFAQIQGLKKQERGHISIIGGKCSFGNRFACCNPDLRLWEETVCLGRLNVFSDEPGRRRESQNWTETQP